MKRKDIMDNCPEEFEDELKEFIDHIEDKFREIRDKLDEVNLNKLDNINDAFDIAHEMTNNLY